MRDETDPNRRQSLAIIAAQAYRIRDMIGDVMLFARPPQPELQDVALLEVAQSVTERLTDDLTAGQCRVEFASGADIVIRADAVQLAVVWSELLRNAVTALQPAGGTIEVRITAKDQFAEWTITDQGRGFTDVGREHAFDPFYSGRQAGRGLGFGLCKVARIVDLHGGTIEITSSPGGPTTVIVRWPRAIQQ